MRKIIKKSQAALTRLHRTAELRPTSLSERDPVAFAAALKVLG